MVKKNYSTIILAIFLSIALVGATVTSSTMRAYSQTETEHGRGICGPMDIAIVLDRTLSMGSALGDIKTELPSIINQAKIASGNDLRVGYITFESAEKPPFKDAVTVQLPLTTMDAAGTTAVLNKIMTTALDNGGNLPEASDEAKDTAVNNLPPRPGQTGDFSSPAWRANPVLKIVVLITDAPPGGFDDPPTTTPAAKAHMHAVAQTAAAKNILVSDVFVPTAGDYAGQAAILKDDADTSNGVFTVAQANGTGTGNAIKTIISNCGKGTPTVQHWDKIVFSIINPDLARKVNLTANTELDIKVLDDPTKVADIKQKVLTFLNVPKPLIPVFRNSIKIINVEYAVVYAPAVSANIISETPAFAKPSSSELAKMKELQTPRANSMNTTNLAPFQNTTSR